MPLGRVVQALRRGFVPSYVFKSLEALGFDWQCPAGTFRCSYAGEPTDDWNSSIKFVSWDAQIDALAAYQAEHGTSKVSPLTTFRAPPASVDFMLAPVLPTLRHHFYALTDAQRLRITSLGLITDMPLWADLVGLLRLYKSCFGPGGVAIDFIVPDSTPGAPWPMAWRGLPLGELAWRLRRRTHVWNAQLVETDFTTGSARTWVAVLAAASVFKSLHHHLNIPRDFVVLSVPQWPQEYSGMKLGFLYHSLLVAESFLLLPSVTRSSLEELRVAVPHRLLKVMSASAAATEFWERFASALTYYHAKVAPGDPPQDYVVPCGAAVNADIRGFYLGAAFASLHKQAYIRPEHLARIDRLRAAQPPPARIPLVAEPPVVVPPHVRQSPIPLQELQHSVAAFIAYRRIFGHCNVTEDFIVPVTAEWHPRFHGVHLGFVATSLRHFHGRLPPALWNDLCDLGFVWATADGRVRCDKAVDGAGHKLDELIPLQTLVYALEVYRCRYGTSEIPPDFVVPSHDFVWPAGTQGVYLTSMVKVLALHIFELPDALVQRLQRLNYFAHLPTWCDLVHLLQRYKELHCMQQVYIDYVVNDRASSWHGLALGHMVWCIGLKQLTLPPARQAVFAGTSATWDRVLHALVCFKREHGHLSVLPTYVVPNTAPTTPGLFLGNWYVQLQRCQSLGLLNAATEKALTQFTPSLLPTVSATPWVPANVAPTFWTQLMLAINHFKQIMGHSDVPYHFTFYTTNAVPAYLRGYNLGNALDLARQQPQALCRMPLENLGVIWDVESTIECCDYIRVLTAWLSAEQRLDETVAVGALPACPLAMANTPIGAILTVLESAPLSSVRRAGFAMLNFDYQSRWTIKICALVLFQNIYGHVNVPLDFVVPSCLPWSPVTWRLPLGHVVLWMWQCQRTMAPAPLRQLTELGLWAQALPKTTVYAPAPPSLPHSSNSTARDRSYQAPTMTPTPASAVEVSVEVTAIADPCQQPLTSDTVPATNNVELELAVETADTASLPRAFAEEVTVVEWQHCLPGLDQYKKLHGTTAVPAHFCVPKNDCNWPSHLSGYPLGSSVQAIRSGQVILSIDILEKLVKIAFFA
ncbi:hypothetical protein ACHHYP_14963 [Achlya hypogyna]|uniref:Helicase-associated domain-containing protein n=1 Tax=Achlya hypogyna TaxID=1202772 RepID=A0A1V9YBZ5_ACHHY|nr:hypothetical protein ACHHYP_14963 [Achlya hypogyna]